MIDLIAALTIFLKYGNPRNPTNCQHDIMWFCIDPENVSAEDIAELGRLGVLVSSDVNAFYSHRFGSC